MNGKGISDKKGVEEQRPEFLTSVTMSDSDFSLFSELIQNLCAIRMPIVKKTMLEARLRKRMRVLGLTSFRQYWNYIDSSQGRQDELVHMIDVVTTNKTDFFREPAHVEYLYNTALPDLQAGWDTGKQRSLRVWSAGCSTGKEAYTLAMILTEYSRNKRELDFSILGTDISTKALGKAARGIFDQEKAATIPVAYRKKYLLKSRDKSGRLIRIVPEIRSLVTFGRLNFLDENYGFNTPFDVIFCRNVIIYFDRENQQRILSKVCRHLAVGGYLFTGHSETLHGMKLPITPMAPSVYRKES
jgi:chemotaxis protein methyltransferase CheR